MEPERSTASLAMQSHHILFWSCRHWGSPCAPLLTIRTCHWIPFKKKTSHLPFSLHLSVFCSFLALTITSPATFFSNKMTGTLSSIYHFAHFSWRWRQSFWRRLWSSCLLFCYSALPPDCLSVDIIPDSAHANDMGEMRGGSIWIQHSLLPRLLLLTRRLLFPGLRRSGLSGWSTLRNPGHGVSLGKQRPGQQGFTRALIILRAISGGSPALYTLLELLCPIVQSLL